VDAPINVATTGVFSSYSVSAIGNNRQRRSVYASEDEQSRVSFILRMILSLELSAHRPLSSAGL